MLTETQLQNVVFTGLAIHRAVANAFYKKDQEGSLSFYAIDTLAACRLLTSQKQPITRKTVSGAMAAGLSVSAVGNALEELLEQGFVTLEQAARRPAPAVYAVTTKGERLLKELLDIAVAAIDEVSEKKRIPIKLRNTKQQAQA